MGWIVGGALFAVGAIAGAPIVTVGGACILGAHTLKTLRRPKKD